MLATLKKIVQPVRRDEQEGIVMPWWAKFTLVSTGSRRSFDTNAIIARYDQRIAMSMMADFIMLGHESVGSFALGASKVDLFMAAVESWVRLIAETFNSHAIPRLIALNGLDTARCPSLTYGQVNAIDLNELGGYLANLTSAQLLTPDNNLEEYLREIAGLPGFRPEPEGSADNTRYAGGQVAPEQSMTQPKGFVGVAATSAGATASPNGNTKTTPVKNPQGGPADQSGGSGIQADITSAGYTGEAPPSSKGPTKNTTGQSGPLTNNQGSTT